LFHATARKRAEPATRRDNRKFVRIPRLAAAVVWRGLVPYQEQGSAARSELQIIQIAIIRNTAHDLAMPNGVAGIDHAIAAGGQITVSAAQTCCVLAMDAGFPVDAAVLVGITVSAAAAVPMIVRHCLTEGE
jgi:hypothetical protein